MRILLSLLLIFTFYTQALASFQTSEELSKWITYYYKSPEPNKVPEAYEFMSKKGWFDKKNSVSPLFGFLSGAIQSNPHLAKGWVERLEKLPTKHQNILVLGVWYSDINGSKELVYKLLEKNEELKQAFSYLYEGSPLPVEEIPLEQGPWVLDALWGKFMATGDTAPVVRIISALPWVDVKGDTNRLLVGGSARWSLTSNAEQHKRVLKICEEQIKIQPENVVVKLKEVIDSATNNNN